MNVNHLGFGFVDKAVLENRDLDIYAVLENRDLDIYAKAVYAYLCVYRNNKTGIAFPSMRKLCTDLNICRNTAIKALHSLRECNVIASRFRAYWGYKFTIPRQEIKGFGSLPKAIMINRSLSAKSKAIYALLCAYAGNKGLSFPRATTICRLLKISRSTYDKYMRQLVASGAVIRKQRRIDGKFNSNLYTLSKEIKLEKASYEAAHIQLIKNICGTYGLTPAPIKYFSNILENIFNKYGRKHIQNIPSYLKTIVKNYMDKHNIPVHTKAMSDSQQLLQKQALLRWQIENVDLLLAEQG